MMFLRFTGKSMKNMKRKFLMWSENDFIFPLRLKSALRKQYTKQYFVFNLIVA